MEYIYFARGNTDPDLVLRRSVSAGFHFMESYAKTHPWWQNDMGETREHDHGEDDHYPITEEEAMAIIARWAEELPVEQAIENIKKRIAESNLKG